MKRTCRIGGAIPTGLGFLAVLVVATLTAGGCSPAVGPPRADNTKPMATPDATSPDGRPQAEEPASDRDSTKTASKTEGKGLPRLLDLGAGKCIPCKMMAPILEELKAEYAGVIDVEFIDVWKQPEEAKKYGVETIPTQIFFDATGKEFFRHVGFFSKEDILAKWKEIGVERKQRKELNDV